MTDLPPAIIQSPPAAVSAVLTETEVKVNSGFRGATISVYGAVFDPQGRPADVVVVIAGPEQPLRIARKSQVAGIWLNSRPVVFRGAPGFYRVASSRPLGEVARFADLRRLGLGLDHLAISAPMERRIETRYGVRDMVVNQLGADYFDWRSAVIRLKQKAGLYSADPAGVRYVDRGLFQAQVVLPADAPTGLYKTRIILFQDGRPVSVRDRTLTVEKVGVERALYLLAHRHPWLYGLASMALALAAGWAASRVFRRS
ncbi:uncharacterized protein (TIGR02186 family) [Caulobacter ginsengisoli]|uniref:Uncharacterized protein (TIGR02186 family) n=1 Tax=Caulobacter ginsengisoli TaxID=400775 RepID=A0ABU0IV77_9CAUL|nr:TIGR02186 family protein [Caulobacter ginsengisoli]MDQ0465923.1 uncharacterized protein (TIGR02186 family) [Caulobacter ginsengisoli]